MWMKREWRGEERIEEGFNEGRKKEGRKEIKVCERDVTKQDKMLHVKVRYDTLHVGQFKPEFTQCPPVCLYVHQLYPFVPRTNFIVLTVM